MVRSVRASLDYYTRQFGPYPYSHLSVVEHPGERHGDARRGQHDHAREGFSLWNPRTIRGASISRSRSWRTRWRTSGRVPYAPVEGAPVMSESLAWYSAMRVVENATRASSSFGGC